MGYYSEIFYNCSTTWNNDFFKIFISNSEIRDNDFFQIRYYGF